MKCDSRDAWTNKQPTKRNTIAKNYSFDWKKIKARHLFLFNSLALVLPCGQWTNELNEAISQSNNSLDTDDSFQMRIVVLPIEFRLFCFVSDLLVERVYYVCVSVSVSVNWVCLRVSVLCAKINQQMKCKMIYAKIKQEKMNRNEMNQCRATHTDKINRKWIEFFVLPISMIFQFTVQLRSRFLFAQRILLFHVNGNRLAIVRRFSLPSEFPPAEQKPLHFAEYFPRKMVSIVTHF